MKLRRLRDRFQLAKLSLFGDRNLARALTYPIAASELERFQPIEHEREVMGSLSKGSKPAHDARFLYRMVRALKPRTVLELGTNVGISSSYIALALPPGGRVITLEGRDLQLNTARELHERLRLSDRVIYSLGRFDDTLPQVLRDHQPIDMAFIDGDHHKEPTLAYTEMIARFASPGAVFVYDDIRWTPEMSDTWNILQADSRFSVVVDLKVIGITRLAAGGSRRYVTPRLSSVLKAG